MSNDITAVGNLIQIISQSRQNALRDIYETKTPQLEELVCLFF